LISNMADLSPLSASPSSPTDEDSHHLPALRRNV
jgi:hypothetical protein